MMYLNRWLVRYKLFKEDSEMKRQRLVVSWLCCLVLSFLVITFTFQASTEARGPKNLRKYIIAVAKAYLTAKNRVLVEGESATVLSQDRLAPSYQDIFQGSVPRLLAGHKLMIDESTPYTSYTTEVKTDKVEMQQQTITLEVTEYTRLYLGGDDPLTPEYTESHIRHVLTFIQNDNKQWILVKDDVPFEPGLSEPQAESYEEPASEPPLR